MARRKVIDGGPSSPVARGVRRRREAAALETEDAESANILKRGHSTAGRDADGSARQKTDVAAGSVPGDEPEPEDVDATPTPRKRGRPRRVVAEADSVENTPKLPRFRNSPAVRTSLRTPSKTLANDLGDTPSRRSIADRSARRKSARALIDRAIGHVESDDEEVDTAIAREIYESSGTDEDEDAYEGVEAAVESDGSDEPRGIESAVETPSRRRTGARTVAGSTKKSVPRRKRSPTPPRDLPPHEQYFFQNKPGLAKTSNNNLSSVDLLTHDEYFNIVRKLKNPHQEEIAFLHSLHAESFPQWVFELSQGFSICLYGYGSKRLLLRKFAGHLYSATDGRVSHKIVVVNGYVRTAAVREILSTIANAIDPSHGLPSTSPVMMVQSLLALLSSHDLIVSLIVNSIDAPSLRKTGTQSILAQLAAHPQVRLVCSADTPDVSLLWDSGLRSSFNFLFHDCTTFAPYTAELDVVDDVHELLGRKAQRLGGKDGVAFVLRSLPENAKSLFRLLVGEVLVLMDDEEGGGGESPGIEYRMLYNKAVEEFICSSEMAFRTLLKEFHDHQIVTSRKDAIGTELLSLPFRKDELESILEDLTS
ncbi:hypothetical protein VTK73DRAFT_2111 [Phialemonium thermophilum]|uniref:Origin recognition complex subunit 2 n=1 Tax=Phialemonium thermophilum TaxID=223376 RepID=A0ABR3X5X3_9PEZI